MYNTYCVNKICNLQSWYLSDEYDGISASLENSQKMVQTCNTELNTLKGQLAAAHQQINALKESKEEVEKLILLTLLIFPSKSR